MKIYYWTFKEKLKEAKSGLEKKFMLTNMQIYYKTL